MLTAGEPIEVHDSELDPERAAEFDRLLDAALDLPEEARPAWLSTIDTPHDKLKSLLLEVLARTADVETNDFLRTLPKLGAVTTDAHESMAVAATGKSIGPYRLVREIGSGGMASVWLAERSDGLINRPVALKLPHVARAAAGLAERMAREREVLAALEHPNIARLYDAGVTAEDRPYLALEYVDGRDIDVYCSESALTVAQRLTLFIQAARAVAYAHGKLVIHRDLKPANILVTADGHVKLLDFGIAKLLEDGETEHAQLTELFGRALTPDYASPEQIRGEQLTVASDVYSLGVLLCRLLTGSLPYKPKRRSRGALEEAILHDEPVRPSELAPPLARALRGDLDTIVAKALRKAPEDRYLTAHAFVDDIERHLTGQPVMARPDSTWYRAAKLVARNKLAVAAAVTVVAAVVLGAGLAAWQARVALAERDRAEEVNEFIASIFREADPYAEAGRALTGVELLQAARMGIVDRFGDRPEIRVELLGTVGSSLTNLGDLPGAEEVLRQTIDEATDLYGPRHATTLRARVLLAEVHNVRRDADTLRAEIAELMPLARAGADDDPETLIRLLKIDIDLAFVEGRFADIAAPAREAFELAARTLGERHPLTVTLSSLLAESFVATGPPDAALAETERGLELALASHGGRSDHPQVIYIRELRGRAFALAGRFQAAIEELEAVIEAADTAFGPRNSMSAYALASVAPYYRRVGAIGTAVERSTAALELHAERIDPKSADYAFALIGRGVTLMAARRPSQALVDVAAAESALREIFGDDHWDTQAARLQRARALAYLGRGEEAEAALAAMRGPAFTPEVPWFAAYMEGAVARLAGDYERAIDKEREAERRLPPGQRAAWERALILPELGWAQLERGDLAEARSTLSQAQALFAELEIEMHPAYADVLLGRGRDALARGELDLALPLLERVDAFWREFDAENHYAGEAAFWLARCHLELGRSVAAAEAFARAERVLSASSFPFADRLLSAIPAEIRPLSR